MSVFYNDTIRLVDVKTDKYGVKNETISDPIKARVEDFNELILDERGQEVQADMLIYAKTTQNTQYTDKVIVDTKGGQTYNQPNKKFKIHKMPLIHGFSAHHKEIYI